MFVLEEEVCVVPRGEAPSEHANQSGCVAYIGTSRFLSHVRVWSRKRSTRSIWIIECARDVFRHIFLDKLPTKKQNIFMDKSVLSIKK